MSLAKAYLLHLAIPSPSARVKCLFIFDEVFMLGMLEHSDQQIGVVKGLSLHLFMHGDLSV